MGAGHHIKFGEKAVVFVQLWGRRIVLFMCNFGQKRLSCFWAILGKKIVLFLCNFGGKVVVL